MKYMIDAPHKLVFTRSEEKNATIYFSFLANYAKGLKDGGKGVVYVGEKFIYGILGDAKQLDLEALKEVLKEDNKEAKNLDIKSKNAVEVQTGTKKKEKVDGVLQFNFMGNVVFEKVAKAFEKFGFKEIKF